MAWYNNGTIAVSGTTVTGTGTNWLDNKFAIGPGQALLIPGSGTVKMYEIKSVDSATKITLMTSPGTLAAGQAYSIMSFYTDSVPDFARRLAAQLSYYQTQMDGWQKIMTSSGAVTLTAPDGTSVTVSSFAKLTADVGNAMQAGTFGFGTGSLSAGAIDWQQFEFLSGMNLSYVTGADTNQPAGFPVLPANYGAYVTVIGRSGTTIHMILTITSANNGLWNMYAMTLTGAKGARALAVRTLMGMENFGYQYGVGATNVTTQATFDFQQADFIVGAHYTVSSSNVINPPVQMTYAAGTGVVILVDFVTSSSGRIGLTIIPNTASDSNFKVYKLLGVGDKGSRVWSVRQEWNSTDVIPVANGGTGGNTPATARTGLGLGNLSTLDAVNRGQLTGEAFRNLFASGGTTPNAKGAGVWSFNNTPFAYNVQYGVCLQVNNRSDALDTAGSSVWQHYLALGTNGEIVYAYNINSSYSARKVYTTGNTTTNSSGALVPASPVVRIVNQRDSSIRSDILGTSNNEYKWVDECSLVNEESQGCSVTRTGVGTYLVKGAVGLAKDLWTVMDCGNGQGRIIALAEAEETEDGIVVRCYKQKYSLSDDGDLTTDKGNQIDIPAESWIDIRLEMPSDSVYNQQQSEVARLLETQQSAATPQQSDSSPDAQDDGS